MTQPDTPTLTAAAIVSLRNDSDALRVITEKLRVKEMGPADHIRTKHEVKAFLSTGDLVEAERLLIRAQARRDLQQAYREEVAQRQGQRMAQ